MDLSQLGGVGGGFIKPAANQPFNDQAALGGASVSGINLAAGATAISLTGKYAISHLSMSGLGTTAGDLVVVLNIDGRNIINKTYANFSPQAFNIIQPAGSSGIASVSTPIICEESMSLYVRKAVAATEGLLAINAIALE